MSDYPNGAAETARMVAYAIEIGVIPAPLKVGERVRVTAGGHRGEEGTVYDVRPRDTDPDSSGPVIVVNLDTLMLFVGSWRCLERVMVGRVASS